MPVSIQGNLIGRDKGGPVGVGVGVGGEMFTLTKTDVHALAHRSAVRRLMPSECEALQGFPRGYTAITYRGKPAADGPRYKALGNSWAVNCARWIGRRIAMVDAIKAERREAA